MDRGGSGVIGRAVRLWRWLAHHQFVAALVLIGLVVAGALARDAVLAARDRAFVQCMAGWAREVTDRSVQLGTARRDLDDANDDLWRTFAALLAAPRPDARQEFQRHLDLYVAASDRYRVSLAANPVPPTPLIRC